MKKSLSKIWKLSLLSSFLLLNGLTNANAQVFKQQRALGQLQKGWYRVELSPELSGSLNPNMGDMRIWAFTETDTLEAPYYIQEQEPQITFQEVAFELLNVSRQADTFYYTYKLPKGAAINQLKLYTPQTNFDWQVRVEGSQTQKQWFTLKDELRLLGIANVLTTYKFTDIALPLTDYEYIRLSIQPTTKPLVEPEIQGVSLIKLDTLQGVQKNMEAEITQSRNVKKNSEWHIQLPKKATINNLKLAIAEDFDYQRPIEISILIDSINTRNGKQARYKSVYSGYISSLEEPVFNLQGVSGQHFLISVRNADNTPLSLQAAELVSYPYKLLFRVDVEGNYKLYYESKTAYAPSYDIANFIDKVRPEDISQLKLTKA